jgi:hypothetical protein
MPEKQSNRKSRGAGPGIESALLLAAAKAIGCRVTEFITWRRQEDGSLIVIDQSGRKYHITAEELAVCG